MESEKVKVKCPEHNTISPAMAGDKTAGFGVQLRAKHQLTLIVAQQLALTLKY